MLVQGEKKLNRGVKGVDKRLDAARESLGSKQAGLLFLVAEGLK